MTAGPRLKYPEWVLFYRQGVSPVKIAELNGVPTERMLRYFQNVRRHYPHLLADRLMLHDQPRPRPARYPDRDRFFRAQLRAFVAFLEEHGRRPAAGHPDEFPLAHWLVIQRSMDRHGHLADHRAQVLDRYVPDWRIPTRQLRSW